MRPHVFKENLCSNYPDGTSFCVNCDCSGKSLPTECPGELVSTILQNDIFDGEIDYIDGKWVSKKQEESAIKQIPASDFILSVFKGYDDHNLKLRLFETARKTVCLNIVDEKGNRLKNGCLLEITKDLDITLKKDFFGCIAYHKRIEFGDETL